MHSAKDNVAVSRHVEELNATMGIAVGGRKENVQQIRSEQITTQTYLLVSKVILDQRSAVE